MSLGPILLSCLPVAAAAVTGLSAEAGWSLDSVTFYYADGGSTKFGLTGGSPVNRVDLDPTSEYVSGLVQYGGCGDFMGGGIKFIVNSIATGATTRTVSFAGGGQSSSDYLSEFNVNWPCRIIGFETSPGDTSDRTRETITNVHTNCESPTHQPTGTPSTSHQPTVTPWPTYQVDDDDDDDDDDDLARRQRVNEIFSIIFASLFAVLILYCICSVVWNGSWTNKFQQWSAKIASGTPPVHDTVISERPLAEPAPPVLPMGTVEMVQTPAEARNEASTSPPAEATVLAYATVVSVESARENSYE